MSQIKPAQTAQTESEKAPATTKGNFNGAAVIDEYGNEVPITEEMIQTACRKLKNAWLFPRQAEQH
ncbi:MAG: hypothetical protein R3208_20825 [Ketobacteraceae bacterium]|nr:hypothetical protein [Ketobacteraceae bacterium]